MDVIKNWVVSAVLIVFGATICSAEEIEVAERPNVVMFVPDFDCTACKLWQLNVMPKLLEMEGVSVQIIRKKGLKSPPNFAVLNKNRWVKCPSILTPQLFREMVNDE